MSECCYVHPASKRRICHAEAIWEIGAVLTPHEPSYTCDDHVWALIGLIPMGETVYIYQINGDHSYELKRVSR